MEFRIKNLADYEKHYAQSVSDPEKYWSTIAENFTWYKKWNTVFKADMIKAEFTWFEGAQVNITENALDRHLVKRGEKTAIIFEPNDPKEKSEHISYNELHKRVCQFANVLLAQGVQKGDRVCIYLPMIPELAISVLACARIGAVHSVVFAGFSSSALASRIEDSTSKLVITADGGFRGNKTIDLKSIVDEALEHCECVDKVLVVKRTNEKIFMKENRDLWLEDLLKGTGTENSPEVMEAEDPLFILYTSGSTGKPKGMLHTTGGYMVGSAFTFANVFQYEENDIFWCTADIGWITGHSYILYGALLNGATTLLFEGIPSYPDFGRFWQVVDKHKVTHLYTAPTAIRSLAKESLSYVEPYSLSTLKVLGSVGEPINEEAWDWYNEHIGKKRCPIVDTWWQTETGSIMISPLAGMTETIPTYATKPLPGVQPILVNDKGVEYTDTKAEGNLCIAFSWPSIARTIWGDHQRYIDTYFKAYPGYYFTGDGALRDEKGNYRITGRVDDVIIVSGHNLGTAPIEDAINEHIDVAESAIVGFPHDIKGNALYGFIILKNGVDESQLDALRKDVNALIAHEIGPIAKLDKIQFVEGLPKTRSGKIMRRILRKVAEGHFDQLGDTSTLLNPEIVEGIIKGRV